MTAERRLVRVNAANLRNKHFYVTGLRDFFPAEVIDHWIELIQGGLVASSVNYSATN